MEENERVLTEMGREGELTDLHAESVTSISCKKKQRKAVANVRVSEIFIHNGCEEVVNGASNGLPI